MERRWIFSINSEIEFSDDSDTFVKFLSGNKHSNHSDDKDNVNDDSDMQRRTWTKAPFFHLVANLV